MKDRIYEQLARIGKAIASPQRIEIVELLAQGERTVEGLATALSMPVPNVSHHLQGLRAARLVVTRKEGTFVHYRLSDDDVFALAHLARTLAQRHLAEFDAVMRTFFAGRDPMEPVTREELRGRLRAGEVVLVDTRPVEEYRAGHIPGAVSLPVAELERRLAELPADKEVIAYCRGPYCVMAYEAVKKLRARGRRARRLVDGFPEWRAAGLPVQNREET